MNGRVVQSQSGLAPECSEWLLPQNKMEVWADDTVRGPGEAILTKETLGSCLIPYTQIHLEHGSKTTKFQQKTKESAFVTSEQAKTSWAGYRITDDKKKS